MELKNPMLEVREMLGWTQSQMANALGWTTHNHVVRIEKGKQKMTALTALALECLVRRKKEELEKELEKEIDSKASKD